MAFVHRCMLTLNPGAPFQPNWHLEEIAYALEKIRTGEVTRLVINAPPRSLKSNIVSVAFPAYMLGLQPHLKIFGISYGTDRAESSRAIFAQLWRWDGPACFPQPHISCSANIDTYTTSRGYRRSTSVNAAITGLGGDCFIVDDPQKAADAQSDALRKQVNNWFSGTLISDSITRRAEVLFSSSSGCTCTT